MKKNDQGPDLRDVEKKMKAFFDACKKAGVRAQIDIKELPRLKTKRDSREREG